MTRLHTASARVYALLCALLLGAAGAHAQSATATLSLADGYSGNGYAGYEKSGTQWHAIVPATLTFTFSTVTGLPAGATLQDATVDVGGTSVAVTASGNTLSAASVTLRSAGSYTPTVTVRYTTTSQTGEGEDVQTVVTEHTFNVTVADRITLYAAPSVTLPTTLGTLKVDDGTVQSRTFSDSASGGYTSGWSRQYTLNGTQASTSSPYTLTYGAEIAGVEKATKQDVLAYTLTNMSPSGNKVWYSATRQLADVTVYNRPPTPTTLNTYVWGTQAVTIAGGLGMTDEEVTQQEVEFDFGGIASTTRSRNSSTATQVRTVYRYDGHVSYSAVKTRDAVNTFSGEIAVSVEAASRTGYPLYEPQLIDGVYHVWAGDAVSYATTASMGNVTPVVEPIATATATAAEIRDVKTTYSFTVTPDTGVEYSYTGTLQRSGLAVKGYAVPGSAIPDNLSSAETLPIVKEGDDDGRVTFRFGVRNASGGSRWEHTWLSDAGNTTAETLTVAYGLHTSGEKRIEQLAWQYQGANYAPNGYKWYETEVQDVISAKIYSRPPRPEALHIYTYGTDTYSVVEGLPYSDEQLKELNISFIYDQTHNTASRLYNGAASQAYLSWSYDDGHQNSGQQAQSIRRHTVTTEVEYGVRPGTYSGADRYAPVLHNGVWHFWLNDRLTVTPRLKMDSNEYSGVTIESLTVGGTTLRSPYESTFAVGQVQGMEAKYTMLVDDNRVAIPLTDTRSDLIAQVYAIPQATAPEKVESRRDEEQAQWTLAPAAVTGGTDNWKYSWTEDGNDRGEQPTYSVTFGGNIDSPERVMQSKTVTMRARNYAPDGTLWYESRAYDMLDARNYNIPLAPAALKLYELGDARYSVASGLGYSDTQLQQYGYRYVFDSNAQTARYTTSAVQSVHTTFTYDDGHVTRSADVHLSTTHRAENGVTATVNAATRPQMTLYAPQHIGSTWHAWLGDELAFADTPQLTNGTGDATFTLRRIAVGNMQSGARTFRPTAAGEYSDPRFEYDVVITPDPDTQIALSYAYTAQGAFAHFYAEPSVPAFHLQRVQVDEGDMRTSTVTLTTEGGNDIGWTYEWDTNGSDKRTADSYTVAYGAEISGDDKTRVDTHAVCTARNTAPNGYLWYQSEPQEVLYASAYNRPRRPASLVTYRYGGNTTTVAGGLGLTPEQRTQQGYSYLFGSNAAQMSSYIAADVATVKTQWRYDDGYAIASEAYADRVVSDITTSVTATVDNSGAHLYSGYQPVQVSDIWHALVGDMLTLTPAVTLDPKPGQTLACQPVSINNTALNGQPYTAIPAAGSVQVTAQYSIEVTPDTDETVTLPFTERYDNRTFASFYAEPTPPVIGGRTTGDVQENDMDGGDVTATVANGYTAGWRHTWTFNDGVPEEQTGLVSTRPVSFGNEIPGNEKTSVTNTLKHYATCYAPDGTTVWYRSDEQTVGQYTVYNRPVLPATLATYTLGQESHTVAGGLGLDNARLQADGYRFIFGDGYTSSGREVTGDHATVYTEWTFPNGFVARSATRQRTADVVAAPMVSYTVEKASRPEFPLYEPIRHDGRLHAWNGDVLTVTPSLRLDNATVEVTSVTLNGNTVSAAPYTFTPGIGEATSSVTYAVHVLPDPDSEIVYPYTVNAPTASVARIYAVPTFAEPVVNTVPSQHRDIDEWSAELALALPAANGNPEGWTYAWRRQVDDGAATTLANGVATTHTDTWQLPNNADVKDVKTVRYAVEQVNTAPDGVTVWARQTTADIRQARIYNTPNAPQGFIVLADGSETANTAYVATRLGLSDALIAERDYILAFDDYEVPRSRRVLVSQAGANISTVRSLWRYDDGYAVFSDPATQTSSVTPANAQRVDLTKRDDYRYLGPVRDDATIYALPGDRLTFTLDVDAAFAINGEPQVTLPNAETTVQGNRVTSTLVAATGTYPLDIDMTLDYVIDTYAGQNITTPVAAAVNWALPTTLQVYSEPAYPVVEKQRFQYRDVDAPETTISIPQLSGANEAWNYRWGAYDHDGTSIDIASHSLSGNVMTQATDNYTITVSAASPVNAAEPWIQYDIDVADAVFYNTPSRPLRLREYRNDEGGFYYYLACELSMNDATLKERNYLFCFDDNIQESRLYEGRNISQVRTLWRYADYDCYGDAREVNATLVPEISATVNADSWQPIAQYADNDSYTGAKRDPDDNRLHVIQGTNISYNATLANSNLTITSATLDVDYGVTSGQQNGARVTHSERLTEPGVYNGTLHGTLAFASESNQNTEMSFSLDLPLQAIVEVWQQPLFPTPDAAYRTQYRDIDPEPEIALLPASLGNPDGWRYAWADYSGTQYATPTFDPHPSLVLTADGPETEQRTLAMHWQNIAPDGTVWFSGTHPYPITVYNTPIQPPVLQKKGNGTSNIYVVTGMPYDDERLNALQYRFSWHDGTQTLGETGERWFNLGPGNSDPHVYALWHYDDYDCYSDSTYDTSEGRGESAIDSIIAEYGTDIRIFTVSGVEVNVESVDRLLPGVYIICRSTGMDAQIQKITVR